MRFLLTAILTVVLAFLAGLFFPWWSIAPAAGIVALLLPQSGIKSFLSAFVAIFILWLLMDIYFDLRNQHILSRRMSLLILQQESTWMILLISSFIGALTGSMGALCGSLLRKRRRRKTIPSFRSFYSRSGS